MLILNGTGAQPMQSGSIPPRPLLFTSHACSEVAIFCQLRGSKMKQNKMKLSPTSERNILRGRGRKCSVSLPSKQQWAQEDWESCLPGGQMVCLYLWAKEMLFGAWNHLKKTKDDCYMPAHDSLEHYAVVGYFCQPNGSKIPAHRAGQAGCTQGCLRDQPPTARHALANATNPEEGRTPFSLPLFYRCWKGGWGDLPAKGVCQGRDEWLWVPALSFMCRLCLLGQIWGKIFISLTEERKKTPSSFH